MSYTRMYGRYSTKSQELSPEHQHKVLRDYHDRKSSVLPPLYNGGGPDSMYFDTATSGSTTFSKRPAGRKLLLDCNRGDHVIFAALDRMTRADVADSLETFRLFNKRGIYVHFLDLLFLSGMDPDDPMTEIHFVQFVQFAQMYRLQISTKTKQAVASRRAQGAMTGRGTPIGYRCPDNPLYNPLDPHSKEPRRHLVIDRCDRDYFDRAFSLWMRGEKIPTIMRLLKNHPGAKADPVSRPGSAGYNYTRLWTAIKREHKQRCAEVSRQERAKFSA